MEDVSVSLIVDAPHATGCFGGACRRARYHKEILMWSSMLPQIGDWIDTEQAMKRIRLAVVNRIWWNRQLTLICRPIRSFSIQGLVDAGFTEERKS